MGSIILKLVTVFLVTCIPQCLARKLSLRAIAGMPDQNFGPMTFTGTIHGIPVQLNGTVQENYAYMRQKYPELAANFTINTNETSSSQVDFGTLNPRAVTMECCPIAYDGYYLTGQHAAKFEEGITYLHNHVGVCGAQANQCSRISCSNDGSIVLCNLASLIPSLISRKS